MIWESISFDQIAIAVGLALLAHLVLGLLALRYNILFLLTAVLLVTSPLSVAVELPFIGLIKIARIYVAILVIVIGIFKALRQPIGPAGKITIFLGLFYFCGLLYSGNILAGLQFKGLVLLNILSGVVLGESVWSMEDLLSALRTLFVACMAFVGFVIVGSIAHGSVGRVTPFGINPNAVASAAAINMTICVYLACYDPSTTLRWLAFAITAATGLITAATGSRTGVVTAAVLSAIIFFPTFRQPGKLVFRVALVLIAAMLLSQFVSEESRSHLADTSNTREGVWSVATQSFESNVLIGPGWAANLDESGAIVPLNAHSIFLQMLGEMGLVGLAVLLITIVLVGIRAVSLHRVIRQTIGRTPLYYFVVAMCGGPVLIGVFENGVFSSSSTQGFFFALAAGLIDRFPAMIRLRLEQYDGHDETVPEYNEEHEFGGYSGETQFGSPVEHWTDNAID